MVLERTYKERKNAKWKSRNGFANNVNLEYGATIIDVSYRYVLETHCETLITYINLSRTINNGGKCNDVWTRYVLPDDGGNVQLSGADCSV